MSVEIHDKMIKLLSSVEEFKQKESELRAEKQRHQDQIAQSEGEVGRCNAELDDIRENQLRLRREMDGLRDNLFRREEEETITLDESHTPTEEGDGQKDSEGRRLWNERSRQLKSVT